MCHTSLCKFIPIQKSDLNISWNISAWCITWEWRKSLLLLIEYHNYPYPVSAKMLVICLLNPQRGVSGSPFMNNITSDLLISAFNLEMHNSIYHAFKINIYTAFTWFRWILTQYIMVKQNELYILPWFTQFTFLVFFNMRLLLLPLWWSTW